MSVAAAKVLIYEQTTADAAVAALIDDRMYLSRGAQSATRPYVVWRETGSEHVDSFAGATAWQRLEIEMVIIADTPDDCAAVSDALEDQWRQFAGTFGIKRVRSWLRRRYDGVVMPIDGSGQAPATITLDFGFWVED